MHKLTNSRFLYDTIITSLNMLLMKLEGVDYKCVIIIKRIMIAAALMKS